MKEYVNPATGLRPFQTQRLAFGLGLDKYDPKLIRQASAFFMKLYEAFMAEDCSMLEINPVVKDNAGNLVALDAVTLLDGDAKFRHKDWTFPFAAEFGRAYTQNEEEVMAVSFFM